jgi:hypothetical protein
MKIWFDNKKIDLSIFKSEKFLLLPRFDRETINKDKDFKDSKWSGEISHLTRYTEIEEADIIVYHDKLDTGIIDTIQLATQYNKKIVAFFNDDKSIPSTLPDCVDLYRTSLYKSKQKKNEFSLPAWSEDFGATETLNIRTKANKPIVGFCGAYTHSIRHEAITQLKKNNNIETDFVIRSSYWGGNVHGEQIRREYIANINNSDLVLCCRGAGNFSYRLFETMSLGRVPIIVDTDIALPCEDIIDWKKIGIWVSNINDINTAIFLFWNNITNDGYRELQNTIRNTYRKFLSPPGFTQYLHLKYSNDKNREI